MRLRSAELSAHSLSRISEYGPCAESQAGERQVPHREHFGELPLRCCDGERVPRHLLVNRQELETLFLGLNQEQFVE